ncbi:MAG TPA: GNAT family N-acetyltransferase [Micropepsaceae bacterium]|nr:GNAT family N-acetyltransferase [Micropepsaceae bacterium]
MDALYPPENRFSIPIDGHGDDNIIFLIARDAGSAIGCGALTLYPGYGELKSIYVRPEARGRRLAAEIVLVLEGMARKAGLEELKLETGIRSPAAIRTYERLGYRQCGRFGNYPEAPLSIFMEKRIAK